MKRDTVVLPDFLAPLASADLASSLVGGSAWDVHFYEGNGDIDNNINNSHSLSVRLDI